MNAIVAKLKELGFSEASVVNDKREPLVYRIHTDKGWVYERFLSSDPDAAVRWAAGFNPPEQA